MYIEAIYYLLHTYQYMINIVQRMYSMNIYVNGVFQQLKLF